MVGNGSDELRHNRGVYGSAWIHDTLRRVSRYRRYQAQGLPGVAVQGRWSHFVRGGEFFLG